MKRLFLALPIPESIDEEIEHCRIGLPGARWVHDLHVTIRFFGELLPERQALIEEALASLDIHAFSLRLGKPGVIVHPGQAILYLHCIPDESIVQLKHSVDSLLGREGFKTDRRFQAHCTIARITDNRSRYLESYLLQFEKFRTEIFSVEELVLFSSILHRSGARHIREESYRLC